MSTTGLTARTEDGVRWLVLDRPDVGNSVTRAMQRDLIDNLARASADSEIRAVVFTAAGNKHFCTGPNLRDPDMRPSQERIAGDAARILRNGSQAVVTALLDCEKPVICGLNGVAAGVGASMVLACDLIVAAESARLIELFVRRGLAPDGGAAYLLARKVPFNIAKQLLLFGEELSAQEAHRIGLVNKVVDGSLLTAEVTVWANRLAQGATRGIAAAKVMLNQALDVDRAAAFNAEALLVDQVAGTDDVAEGVAAFLEEARPTVSRSLGHRTMSNLAGRVALITGASGGIGRVLARRYSSCGAKVALVARRPDELNVTAGAITEEGGESLVLVADIRDEAQCAEAVAATVQRWGRLDVLVNNAAVPGADQPVADATTENWHDVLATNLVAPMVLSREALRQAMIPAKAGNIQFLSSAAARSVQPLKAHYAAAKLGLTALGQTLALEVGAAGIRVNTLVIGSVAGELFDNYVARRAKADGVSPADVRRRLVGLNKLGRLVQPDEVAEVSVWLASDAASAITGQDINVTGG